MKDFDKLKLIKEAFPDTEDFILSWEYNEASFHSSINNISRFRVKLDSYYKDNNTPEYYLELVYNHNWNTSAAVIIKSELKPTVEEAIISFKEKLQDLKFFIGYLGTK